MILTARGIAAGGFLFKRNASLCPVKIFCVHFVDKKFSDRYNTVVI